MCSIRTTVKPTAGWPANWVNTEAMTMVIGPVDPDICAGVPPNSEANGPTQMAP